MFSLKITSKKIFKTTNFYSCGTSIYVYQNDSQKERQLKACKGGLLKGEEITLKEGATEEDFKKACKRWYSAHVAYKKREEKRLKRYSE